MQDELLHSLYKSYENLNPYEIAILTFTSPSVIQRSNEHEETVVVTTKESYIWAGAVAHALERNPELPISQIVSAVKETVFLYFHRYKRYREIAYPRFRPYFLHEPVEVIEVFMQQLKIDVENIDAIFGKIEEAVRSLVWHGYIEDPFNKKIVSIATAILLVMPIGFTSTGPSNFTIDALTWKYVEYPEGKHEEKKFQLKVREATDAVLNEILPAAINAVDKLSGEDNYRDKVSPRDIQLKLAKLGYYAGRIDGLIGPETRSALQHFQVEHSLKNTGYPDEETVQRLKDA